MVNLLIQSCEHVPWFTTHVRVLNSFLGVTGVIWLIYLLNLKLTHDDFQDRFQRFLYISLLMMLITTTSAQILNLTLHRGLTPITWMTLVSESLIIYTCWGCTREVRRRVYAPGFTGLG